MEGLKIFNSVKGFIGLKSQGCLQICVFKISVPSVIEQCNSFRPAVKCLIQVFFFGHPCLYIWRHKKKSVCKNRLKFIQVKVKERARTEVITCDKQKERKKRTEKECWNHLYFNEKERKRKERKFYAYILFFNLSPSISSLSSASTSVKALIEQIV